MNTSSKKRFRVPHTYVIIFSLVVIAAILTWVVPGGSYDRVEKDGRTVVVPDSFKTTEHKPQGLFDILKAPMKGMKEASSVIFFILIIGGAFGIIQETGAINAGLISATRGLKGKEKWLIPVMMTLFSLGGSIYGMCEEIIPFIPMFVTLSLMVGYDSVVGLAIPFVGANLGFSAAFMNPFTLGVAQGISELKPLSGMGFRLVMWAISTTTGILYVSWYAAKVKARPEISIVYDEDVEKRKQITDLESSFQGVNSRHKIVLTALFLSFALLVFGVIKYGWYMTEIAAIFLGMGILAGILAKMPVDSLAENFIKGARELTGAALVVGFGRAILVILSDGKIMDTLLHGTAVLIGKTSPVMSSMLMFVFQTVVNFFVPSGSGQAALTMPIMTPLSDLLGITRQTAVIAFQLGDGFADMIIPTSAVTMAVLGFAGFSWNKWAKWISKLLGILFVLSLIFVGIAAAIRLP